METFVQKFRNLKLSKKMFFVFFVILSGVSVICLAAMQITLDIYDGKLYEKSLEELNYFARTVEHQLEELENVSYNICMDYGIQKQLKKLKEPDSRQDYLIGTNKLRSRLQSSAFSQEYVMDVIYTDGNQMQLHAGKKYQKLSDSVYQQILEEAKSARGAYVFSQPSREEPYLVSGREILEHVDYSLENLGTLLLVSDFQSIIEENRKDLGDEESKLWIGTENGTAYVSDPAYVQNQEEFAGIRGYRVISADSEKYFLCYQKSQKLGWTFVNMFPYTNIFYMNTLVRYWMIGGILLAFLLASICMRKIAGIITAPLERLTKSMEIVQEGKFGEARSCLEMAESRDEIGTLQKDFTIMLERMERLIHDNYEKQILLKDTQYKALQAQINPHFLYNTLNSINWMIKRGKSGEASDMITALGRLFRVAFSKDPMETLGEEMQLLEDYIAIQKVRYGKRMTFTARRQPEAMEYAIPRMILQPLVENAVMYGVENSLEICNIQVCASFHRDRIYLSVEDDGPGMEEEELKKVRTFTMQPKGSGIGLKNIRERLHLVFGEDFTLDIQSRQGWGTRIEIVVPARRREEHV